MDGSEPKRMESVVDMSFLAPPGAVMDWRRVLLTSLADRAGLLDRLPATTAELAEHLKLDPKSIRMNLEALTAWEVVESTDGKFAAGPEFPDDRDRLLIRRHARVLSRWAVELPDRLADPLNRKREPRSAGDVAEWLGALGIRARHWAPAVIDMCLEAFPGARTVLDVAGGHGEHAIEAASRGLDVTMIDLPAVIGSVREWPRVRESGIDLVEGDVFESEITGSFDLVLCFGFTHTQPPERVGTLFRRLAAVTSDGGGIAIKTFIRGASPATLIFAVQKLVAGNNGDTHTRAVHAVARRCRLRPASASRPRCPDAPARKLRRRPLRHDALRHEGLLTDRRCKTCRRRAVLVGAVHQRAPLSHNSPLLGG